MFTDVQSSTLLWDKYPDGMSYALDLHNQLIRHQLTEYKGYEVKTLGDAFMVAFPNASLALGCAMQIQEELVAQNWHEVSRSPPPPHRDAPGQRHGQ